MALFVLLIVPVWCFLISLVLGAMMAAVEDWSLSDGFFFIAALAITATNPIVAVVLHHPYHCSALCLSDVPTLAKLLHILCTVAWNQPRVANWNRQHSQSRLKCI